MKYLLTILLAFASFHLDAFEAKANEACPQAISKAIRGIPTLGLGQFIGIGFSEEKTPFPEAQQKIRFTTVLEPGRTYNPKAAIELSEGVISGCPLFSMVEIAPVSLTPNGSVIGSDDVIVFGRLVSGQVAEFKCSADRRVSWGEVGCL